MKTPRSIDQEVASLRKESKPKALFHIAVSAAKEWMAHRAARKDGGATWTAERRAYQ